MEILERMHHGITIVIQNVSVVAVVKIQIALFSSVPSPASAQDCEMLQLNFYWKSSIYNCPSFTGIHMIHVIGASSFATCLLARVFSQISWRNSNFLVGQISQTKNRYGFHIFTILKKNRLPGSFAEKL